MKEQRHRFLCAVCALALVLTAVLAPAAWAAEGTDEAQAEAKPTLPAADAGANAETALALSDAPETDARKKPSLFRRIKAQVTGGEENGALSPDKEVFEEEENENADFEDTNFYELGEEESADFFDEEQIPFLLADGEGDEEDGEDPEEENAPTFSGSEEDAKRQAALPEKKSKRTLFSWLRKKGS